MSENFVLFGCWNKTQENGFSPFQEVATKINTDVEEGRINPSAYFILGDNEYPTNITTDGLKKIKQHNIPFSKCQQLPSQQLQSMF